MDGENIDFVTCLDVFTSYPMSIKDIGLACGHQQRMYPLFQFSSV